MSSGDTKVILILGGGTMQVPALKAAGVKGWTVIMADGNPEPEGKHLARFFENVDLRDTEGMISMAGRYKETIGLHGVFTAGTDFSLTVARVAESLGLPGVGVETAENATFKDLMRQRFQEAGVPSPGYRVVRPGDDVPALLAGLRGPWVVKPADNMGARGTIRVDTPEGLVEAVDFAFPWSGSSRVIIEEYMDGPEYSIDAIVEDGNMTVCGLADRHVCFPPYFIEMGHTMPTGAGQGDIDEIIRVFGLGVKALGIRNGSAKGDVKLTAEGAKIGEIAARLSGGYMSGWTFPYSSGVDLTGAALNIAVGEGAGDLRPRFRRYSAERAFISIPGIVEEILGVPEARDCAGVRDVFLRVRPNDRVCFPRNNVEKCGNIISCADTREEAVRAAEAAAAGIAIRLRPEVEETGLYLYGLPEKGMPAAWKAGPELRIQLEKMPPFDGSPGDLFRSSLPGIIPLAGVEDLSQTDWHGLTVQEGLKRVYEAGGLSEEDRPVCRLGRPFWDAFFRGGPEGGVWALRTFRGDPAKFQEKVKTWSER